MFASLMIDSLDSSLRSLNRLFFPDRFPFFSLEARGELSLNLGVCFFRCFFFFCTNFTVCVFYLKSDFLFKGRGRM